MLQLYAETPIASVHQRSQDYDVVTLDGTRIRTRQAPLLAHGFVGSHTLLSDLFDARNDGYPLLNDQDESTISPGLFLCGPAVRHDNHIFFVSFINIANALRLSRKPLPTLWGSPLRDLKSTVPTGCTSTTFHAVDRSVFAEAAQE